MLDDKYLKQPEEELTMASLRPISDALRECCAAAGSVVIDGDVLGAMLAVGGAVGKVGDAILRSGLSNETPAVGKFIGSQRFLAKPQHDRLLRLQKNGKGAERKRPALTKRPWRWFVSELREGRDLTIWRSHLSSAALDLTSDGNVDKI
jgi:hypothetical protein